ncbi:hypothetical protein YC2023_018088 [Brassica napus]
MDSFQWDKDVVDDHVSCLVRSSNQAAFQKLELRPADIHPNPNSIEPSKNMPLFTKQWESTVNRTIKVATESNTSSLLQYFGAVKAEFTEFSKSMYWGSQGGEVSRPSCVFWWDLYSFCSAFDNITIFYAPPRVKSQAQPPANDKKGKREIP